MAHFSAAKPDEEDEADAEIAEAVRIDDVIANVRDDAAWAKSAPDAARREWKEYLMSDEFIDDAMDKFDGLDADGNEKLSPEELAPLSPSCRRGSRGTSTRRTASSSPRFLTPTRTATSKQTNSSVSCSSSSVMSFMDSAAEETDDIDVEIAEAVRIDDVIANVRDDAAWADKVLPTLPDEWKE